VVSSDPLVAQSARIMPRISADSIESTQDRIVLERIACKSGPNARAREHMLALLGVDVLTIGNERVSGTGVVRHRAAPNGEIEFVLENS
jgi:hypothetical protein